LSFDVDQNVARHKHSRLSFLVPSLIDPAPITLFHLQLIRTELHRSIFSRSCPNLVSIFQLTVTVSCVNFLPPSLVQLLQFPASIFFLPSLKKVLSLFPVPCSHLSQILTNYLQRKWPQFLCLPY